MICELFSFAIECDIPNWLTMALELIIASVLAGVFFIRQHKQGKKLESIATEQEKFRRKRLEWSVRELRSESIHFRRTLNRFKDSLIFVQTEREKNPQTKIDASFVKIYEDIIPILLNNLRNISNQSIGILDPEIFKIIDKIIRLLQNTKNTLEHDNLQYTISDVGNRITDIDELLQQLQKYE